MAFRYILEKTLEKYKLERLNPVSSETDRVFNDDNSTVISSSCPGLVPDGFTGLLLTIGVKILFLVLDRKFVILESFKRHRRKSNRCKHVEIYFATRSRSQPIATQGRRLLRKNIKVA